MFGRFNVFTFPGVVRDRFVSLAKVGAQARPKLTPGGMGVRVRPGHEHGLQTASGSA